MEEAVETNEVIDLISVLISPMKEKNNKSILDALSVNISNFKDYVEKNGKISKMNLCLLFDCFEDVNPRVVFVNICLHILNILKEFLILEDKTAKMKEACEQHIPPNLLSLQQHNIIANCLELIVVFGIIPNLLDNVGIPIQKRSKSFNYLKQLLTEAKTETAWEKHNQLMSCMHKLLECCEHSILAEKINHYSIDVLSALLQLSYIPEKECLCKDATELVKSEFLKQKRQSRKKLHQFMNKFNQVTLVKELLVLQSKDKGCSSPVWLQKACTKYLSIHLMQPLGIQTLIRAVLNIDDTNELPMEQNDWQKFDVVAKLIVCGRLTSQTVLDYFVAISPQILGILQTSNSAQKRIYLAVLRSFIKIATEQEPDMVKEYIWKPLYKPLLICTEIFSDEAVSGDANIVVDELSFSHAIENIHEIFVLGHGDRTVMVKGLRPIIRLLFYLYVRSNGTLSYLRVKLEEILTTFLRHEDVNSSLILKALIFDENVYDHEDVFIWNPMLDIQVGTGGGLEVVYSTDSEEEIAEITNKCNAVIQLLTVVKNDGIISSFFLKLLQDFSSTIQADLGSKNISSASCDQESLLDIETQMQKQHKVKLKLLLLWTLSENEDLQKFILEDKESSIHLLKAILLKAADSCSNSENHSLEIENLTMAMTVLFILISQQNPGNDKLKLKSFLPYLETLSEKHSDETIKQMADELQIAIGTEGIIMSTSSVKTKTKSDKTDFEIAWHDLQDPLLPVRGNALIKLRKLIVQQDKDALSHKNDILAVFQKNLTDDDSYIYLTAIQGLAALTNVFPDTTIPCLTAEFANYDGKLSNNPVLRLKLGEVLVKVIKDLGIMAPKYGDHFLRAFLSGCKDEDTHVRASSLSNLGEVCKELKFAVGSCLYEIMNCVQQLLNTDNNVEVKQASLLVITLLVRGAGEDILKIMGDIIRDLYRLLKRIYSNEKNDKIKIHAQLAIEEINNVMKKFAFPEQKLTKNIYVLDAPPQDILFK